MRTLVIAWSIGLIACRGTADRGAGSAQTERRGAGVEIVYDLDADRAIEDKILQVREELESELAELDLKGEVRTPVTPLGAISVGVADPGRRAQIEARMASYGDLLSPRACSDADGAGAICMRISEKYAASLRTSVWKNAAKTIRNRLEAGKIEGATVIERAGTIVVGLPGLAPEAMAETRDLIARSGALALKVVDDGSPFMQRLFAHVGSVGKQGDPGDSAAVAAGVRAEVEAWRAEDGVSHQDYYLIARDREDLATTAEAKQRGCWTKDLVERAGRVPCRLAGRQVIAQYLAELARQDPSYTIPDDREISYEHVEPRAEPGGGPASWRSYYLDRRTRLSGRSIADASAEIDPNTHRPQVMIELNGYGRRLFADLTSRTVGKKLAILLDGTVTSAPVINTVIAGGRAVITVGGADPEQQQRAAGALATVLKLGALPAPLHELAVRSRP